MVLTALKLRKSAGIPVSLPVHRFIADGNRARSVEDWAAAASAYQAALERDDNLAHIWVQLGHALKEQGDLTRAKAAYVRASQIAIDDGDPHLHLGHLAKLRGEIASAARHYIAAARLARTNPDALAELQFLLAKGVDVDMDTLLSLFVEEPTEAPSRPRLGVTQAAQKADAALHDLLEALHLDGGDTGDVVERTTAAADFVKKLTRDWQDSPKGTASRPALVFDVSDLFTYFKKVRSPTGIQRVQIETIVSAIRAETTSVQICCFLEQRDEWIEIPQAIFLRLCRLSLGDDAGEWTTELAKAFILLSVADPIRFADGAFLINLGTSWWLQNYFLFIRRAKQLHGIRYVPFVHDMIPVLRGEFCPQALTQDFISWAIGVFEHADYFFANSEATKRDLIKVGAYLGRTIDPDTVSVVRLDADYRKPTKEKRPLVRKWALDNARFVLFVSTIEPRKNHLRAFEAWIALLRRHGPNAIPMLVCVGHPGWLNDAIHEQLRAHEMLRNHVRMLSQISDAELAQLYERCMFTIYPSHYEGWGLPVTESLCYGKVPLVSNVSALPEAGGSLAVYFDPDSTNELTDALERLIFDAGFRAERERDIVETFRPRSWASIAEQMATDVIAWKTEAPKPAPVAPLVQLGAYHPLGRNLKTRIWPAMRSGEIYRAGTNWWGPDNWGCWTKPGGGLLEIDLPTKAPMKMFLRLSGMPSVRCPFRIDLGDEIGVARGDLSPGEMKWVPIDIPAREEGASLVKIHVSSTGSEDLRGQTNNSDPRVVSVGVAGFFISETADALARGAFLEAASIGNVDDLSFSREPYNYVPLS